MAGKAWVPSKSGLLFLPVPTISKKATISPHLCIPRIQNQERNVL